MSNTEQRTGRRHFVMGALAAGIGSCTVARGQTRESSPRTPFNPKITEIKTYKFNVPTGKPRVDPGTGKLISSAFKTWLFLKIETNTDLYGWGEASIEWLSPVVEKTIQGWRELLVGRNPLDVVAICDDITDRLPWKGGPILGSAIAAINMALYDITGKAWKVPVYQVLGGRKRDRIKVYNGSLNFESVEKARAIARAAVDAGARGLKGNPLEARIWPMDQRVVEHCTNVVAGVREEVGPNVHILLDTHGSPTPALAILFAKMVAPYRPLFLEEPCKVGDVAAMKEIARQSPVPIATGEKLFTARAFKEVIDARACAFLQPDVSHSFGLNHFLKIAHMAEEAQMLMAPHNAGGPVHFASLLHVDAVISNFLVQEVWNIERHSQYVDHDFEFDRGYVALNDRPGLGIDVNENHIAKLPYKSSMAYREYRNADGSWKGW